MLRMNLVIPFLAIIVAGCGETSDSVLITLDESGDAMTDMGVDAGPTEPTCAELAEGWSEEWVSFEDQVIELVNEYRAQGADCRSGGQFPPALPLGGDEELRCAARRHSLDMQARDYFDHLSPEGETPGDRVGRTDYEPRALGENIAAGQMNPDQVVAGWMRSDPHCANIMNSLFEELGVGYSHDPDVPTQPHRRMWTQVFGTPF